MESRIRERFSPRILERAGAAYGVSPEELEPLGGFESFIYRYAEEDGSGRILRLAHSIRRTPEMIRGEVEFIKRLASKGIPAADTVPSVRGYLVEGIPDGFGGSFLATAFREVKGATPWEKGWSRDLFTRYGSLMGAMHRVSREMPPMSHPRPPWNSNELGGDLTAMLPPGEESTAERIRVLESTALALPAGPDSYGLVHYDMHGGNMLIDPEGAISIFDFDDCCTSWFIADIAIALFYMVTNHPSPEEAAVNFLEPFLKGYSGENRLDPRWLEHVGLFLSIREADLYAVIHRSLDLGSLDPWCAGFMEGRRERMEKGIPYLDMDFTRFEELLI